ncbi:hypothetical protein SKAU_G00183890, partial [Synaphobranchus kaupii]
CKLWTTIKRLTLDYSKSHHPLGQVLLWRSETSVGMRNETERANQQAPTRHPFWLFCGRPQPPHCPGRHPFSTCAVGPAEFGDPEDVGDPGATVFALQLFGTEEFQERTTGLCVIMANTRVYVEVSVNGVERGGVEVASPAWCRPSRTPMPPRVGPSSRTAVSSSPRSRRFGRAGPSRKTRERAAELPSLQAPLLQRGAPRGPNTGQLPREGPVCPPLIPQPHSQQCEYRYLLRPMLVTLPLGRAQRRPSSGSEVDTGSVVGVSFAAFIIGVILMGALWCIYTRTGVTLPLRRVSLQDPVDQTAAAWTPPDLLEQSSM